MGRLLWPYQTVITTPMAAIELAEEGQNELLTSIFGGAEKKKLASRRKITPKLFDALFGRK